MPDEKKYLDDKGLETLWEQVKVLITSKGNSFATIISEGENPVLALGEIGLDTTNHTVVVGDGSTAYNSLQYYLNLGTAYNTTSYIHTSVALGLGASASSYYTTAVGYYSNATGSYSTALGYDSNATAIDATALGYMSTASGNNATALGYMSTASGNNATALGYNSNATATDATAVGYYSNATANYATALGYDSYASANYAIKIGYAGSSTYYASGTYSIAIGYHSGATYNYSAAFGYNAQTTATYQIQLGGSSNSYVYYYGTLSSRSDERDKFDMRQFDNKAILDFVVDLDTFDYLRNPRELYEYTELDENGEEYVADPNHEKYGLGAYDHEAHERGDKAGSRRRAGISAQNIQEKMQEHFGAEYNLNLVNDNLYDKRKAGEEIPEDVESQLEVSYISFIPLLISCIKEQQKEIEELKEEIEGLKK